MPIDKGISGSVSFQLQFRSLRYGKRLSWPSRPHPFTNLFADNGFPKETGLNPNDGGRNTKRTFANLRDEATVRYPRKKKTFHEVPAIQPNSDFSFFI